MFVCYCPELREGESHQYDPTDTMHRAMTRREDIGDDDEHELSGVLHPCTVRETHIPVGNDDSGGPNTAYHCVACGRSVWRLDPTAHRDLNDLLSAAFAAGRANRQDEYILDRQRLERSLEHQNATMGVDEQRHEARAALALAVEEVSLATKAAIDLLPGMGEYPPSAEGVASLVQSIMRRQYHIMQAEPDDLT